MTVLHLAVGAVQTIPLCQRSADKSIELLSAKSDSKMQGSCIETWSDQSSLFAQI